MSPPRYVPLDGGPWRLSMGLRRLELSQWLEVDEHRDEELAYKSELLGTARDEVLAVLPGSDAAAGELREMVGAHLADVLGERVVFDDALHPVEAAARAVQEDLCVLEHVEGQWRLTAACVCFPSRWRLADKLGATVAQIHDPVPGFERDLGRQTATFFDRLDVGRPVWRCNWTVLDTPELHLPAAASRRSSREADPGDLWFRVERQTLRRLPSSGAIVFTIRTYRSPLARLAHGDPAAARALRDTLATVPEDVAAYKGWTTLLAPTVAWLDAAAALKDEAGSK